MLSDCILTKMNMEKDNENDSPSCELIGDKEKIVSSISRFYNNAELSDIILKLGSQQFHAHKFVLLLMSDVFKTMCSQRWDGDNIQEIELNECEQCIPAFPMFLHFLYHGQVYISTTSALPLLMLADKYNVDPLKCLCECYVQKQVKEGNVVGAIRWLPYLQLCGQRDLEEACIEVIVIEMEYVLSCNDFLLLNINLLTLLLTRNDLVVDYEYTLYEGVVKWIQSLEDDDSTKDSYINTLIPLIRFSMMFPEQLLEIETSSFYDTYRSLLCPYIALAHRFRSLAAEVGDEGFSGDLYRPRNYTSSLWCQVVSLDADNVSFYNKCFNTHNACDLLSSSTTTRDPTWQVQVVRGDKDDKPGKRSVSENDFWHSSPPTVFPNNSTGSSVSLPIQINLRPLKEIRSNMVVDVSLFLVRKERIYKHLDTATFFPLPNNNDKSGNLSKARVSNLRLTPREKMFSPSPMHFSFASSQQIVKEPKVSLRYRFIRGELDSPPEVPCVSFGPNFGHPPRPIHSITVAIITKPRFKSRTDAQNLPMTSSDESVGDDRSLPPILG